MNKQTAKIRQLLEGLYARYNRRRFIGSDPLQFVYRYSNREDMEIAGFLASALAYGRVAQIEKSLDSLFGLMGDGPGAFVRNFDKDKRKKLAGFKHRFTTGADIADLLESLKEVLNRYGSIEKFFLQGCSDDDPNIIPALSKFCDSLLEISTAITAAEPSKGLKYLLVRPRQGSACKRLNLFLRWMVRDDAVDSGLWRSVDRSKLIVPVDVHMGRLCRILGFFDRKTVSLAAAVKITQSFAEIQPDDPVKYDFALSRIGIIEGCTGHLADGCGSCRLYEFCAPNGCENLAATGTYGL